MSGGAGASTDDRPQPHTVVQPAVRPALLAGSYERLIYSDSHSMLDVRNRRGDIHSLGIVPDQSDYYSLTRNMLTAEVPGGVAWWNLAKGTDGVTAIPRNSHYYYVGATPTGWLLGISDDNAVYQESTAGVVTSLGTPELAYPEVVTPGPDGFLASTSLDIDNPVRHGVAVYQRWSQPRHFSLLRRWKGDEACISVNTRLAACVAQNKPTAHHINRVALLPLEGGRVRVTKTCADHTMPARGFSYYGTLAVGGSIATACNHVQFLTRGGRSISSTVSARGVIAYDEYAYIPHKGRAIRALTATGRRLRPLVANA
jgi:hypothetical protein